MNIPRQNCVSYKEGDCLHQAAPRKLFGTADCILNWPSADRRVIPGCALQTPIPRPLPPKPITQEKK